MDIFFGNFFWGILIILFGLSIFLKGFNINLPLMKVFFAIVIILFGVKLLVGGKPRIKYNNHNYTKGSSIHYNGSGKEYTMVFSSGTFDLTDLPEDAKDFEITVVFGSALVILPNDLNYNISPTSVFGGTVLPRQPKIPGVKAIDIESTAVFGRLEYEFKDRGVSQPKQTVEPDSLNPGDGF